MEMSAESEAFIRLRAKLIGKGAFELGIANFSFYFEYIIKYCVLFFD